jgi:hypothetical protein
MKENFTIRVIAILWVVFQSMINVYGQVPQKFSYQAVIRNASNALVINQAVGMRVSILQSTATQGLQCIF